MMVANLLGLILMVGFGVLIITGAVLDWDWFMDSRHVRFFAIVFGDMVARVICVLAGLFVIIISAILLL